MPYNARPGFFHVELQIQRYCCNQFSHTILFKSIAGFYDG